MILSSVLVLALLQDSTAVYSGTAKRTDVDIPRLDTVVTIDGSLDEPVWTRAAKLTAFSQYQPVDGRPAEDPTEVMVWYSPEAIHFGVRARELHGNVVRATQANRDNIASEDQIQILLDTNDDRSIAYLFGVNPLSVQQDGTRSSSTSVTADSTTCGLAPGKSTVTDTIGGSASGNSRTGKRVYAIAPTRTSPRLIMLDSTGRRMNLSANCISLSSPSDQALLRP